MFTILIRAGSDASWVDWRADYPALSYEWVDTPPEVEKGLRAYLDELGLAYAAIDFAIDADNRWVFLESNSSGQHQPPGPGTGHRRRAQPAPGARPHAKTAQDRRAEDRLPAH
ncbi:MAG: hypothetical protein ACRDRP_17580 [Pseudonocardiaceae bacterium]